MLSDLKWLKSFIFAAAVGLAAVQLYRINATRTDIMSSSMRALFVHPAVSALGIDFVLSALSAQMWNFQQGYAA
jgi:NAD/NADP transhydrogenase alpha subunit